VDPASVIVPLNSTTAGVAGAAAGAQAVKLLKATTATSATIRIRPGQRILLCFVIDTPLNLFLLVWQALTTAVNIIPPGNESWVKELLNYD
jgi:hypothetical protein